MKRIYLFIALLMGILPTFAQNKTHSNSKQQYTINATAPQSGYGSVTGGGVYNEGDTCVLTATPTEGHAFLFWYDIYGYSSYESTYAFVVTEDRDVYAGFSTLEYNISVTVTPTGYGSVTGAKKYKHGETCSLMAQFYDGYDFEKWTENGVEISTNPVLRFTVTGERSLKAHFFKRNYTVTASVDPEEAGIVEGGGLFTYGESCFLKTFPHSGYDFIGWKRNNNTLVSTDAIYVFDVTQSANYVACYEPKTYTVFVNANPSNGGFVTGSGSYQTNQDCTVTATPAEGYRFVGWTEDNDTISYDNNYTFTVLGNSNLVANFIPNTSVGEQQVSIINVFPNPINDKLTIESEECITLIEIYSITGSTVLRHENCANKMTLSLSDLPNGTYFVRITSESFSEIRKFVK